MHNNSNSNKKHISSSWIKISDWDSVLTAALFLLKIMFNLIFKKKHYVALNFEWHHCDSIMITTT